MEYLLLHYRDFDIFVQTVAETLKMKPAEITATLKEMVGLKFVQYISYLRMNEFKRLLSETDRSITDLVREIGYSDVPNFMRKFKTIEGITPGQYRSLHQSANQ